MASTLRADVYVSSRLPLAIKRDGTSSSFSPISCTLIHGAREAVLVDTPISVEQTKSLIAWIDGIMPQKELSYIYITHGHGDHWFGVPVLRQRWPNVKVIATKATVDHMKRQLQPEMFGFWSTLFPGGQISDLQEVASAMSSPTFTIERHEFCAVEVGHTDTVDTTVLHVPDLSLVVAGDVVYGDVHQHFGEADTTEKRTEWLSALDKVETLKPQVVVAGHKREGSVDGVYNVHATREYILEFEKGTKECGSAAELYKRMQERFPTRINPHAILRGAAVAFPGTS